ncbi:MAG: cellulose synthase complex periplasmic endoglucanase BcsZ [Pseudomonadota bacterium]
MMRWWWPRWRRPISRTALPVAIVLVLTAGPAVAAGCAELAAWPAWQQFQKRFISTDGRVIDHGSAAHVTTSEGQAYGMLFALIANDPAGFERLLDWTTNHLARGNLDARLPAWQWGKRADGSWGVLDDNAASDADLWMAYALTEAGRLWNRPRYADLGRALAARIMHEETALLTPLGRVLLPGPRTFRLANKTVRLNPSYYPIQVLRRLAKVHPTDGWNQIAQTSISLLRQSADQGYFPDWILYQDHVGFLPDQEKRAIGSYDAIRVYLWAGMLDAGDPLRAELIAKADPIIQYVVQQGVPPLEIDTLSGAAQGYGPVGFSAALLPILAVYDRKPLLQQQHLRVINAAPLERRNNYYEQVLTLFGLGWLERRYRFDADGALQPDWTCR